MWFFVDEFEPLRAFLARGFVLVRRLGRGIDARAAPTADGGGGPSGEGGRGSKPQETTRFMLLELIILCNM
jgi:hypothetical protein